MTGLPDISLLTTSPDAAVLLSTALSILFEPSPILQTKLIPSLASSPSKTLATYAALIDLATFTVSKWEAESQAEFIAAHPRIGQISGLSLLSQQEQAAKAVPPDVLASLAHLNERYETRFPRLRYVTFVNGRSRTEIRDEMKRVLGEDDVNAQVVFDVGSPEWCAELKRAVRDVGRIAKSRVQSLGAV